MALQFNPPETLIAQFLQAQQNEPTPAERTGAGIQQALQIYMQQRALKAKEEALKLDAQKTQFDRDNVMRNRFYEYGDPSGLPTEERGMLAPAQGPARPVDYAATQQQSGLVGPLTEQQANTPDSAPIQPTWDPANPSHITGEYMRKFMAALPQGTKGRSKAQEMGLTEAQFQAAMSGDDKSLTQAFGGQPIPLSVARLSATAQGQKGVQNRFNTKLDQGVLEKGAKATADVAKSVNAINEGRQFLRDMTKAHGELVDAGLAGDPLRKFIFGGIATATGGRFGTEKFKAFKDNSSGMIARLKKVTGDTGVMTDVDQARLAKLFADLGETKEAAATKLAMAEKIFDLAERGEKERLSQYLRDIGIKTTDAVKGSPNDDPSALSEEELEQIAGGGSF